MILRLVFLSLLWAPLSASGADKVIRVNGAGATFPYPLYSKWFTIYNRDNPGVRFNYQAIGSGGGIRQLLKETVDFGASDAPMRVKDHKKSSRKIHHIPTVLGAVSMSYNLPGLQRPLKLDGTTLADIFLGRIKKWNDPSITSLNPALPLPERPILVVRRADGSGTTAIFSDYLSAVSPLWKKDVGQGKTLRWPVGIGAKGNDGVAAQIKNNQGAIGYVELAYSIKIGLPTVALKNLSGKFIAPSIASISASARNVTDTKDGLSIVNAAGDEVYPISAFTYILLPEGHPKERALKTFLRWALTKGQQHASPLHYAPSPPTTLSKPTQKTRLTDDALSRPPR